MRLAMLIVPAAVLACSGGDRLYSGPASAPDRVTVGVGEYATFSIEIREGTRAPMEVSSMTARCAPAAVCAATVVEKRVVVFGAAGGEGVVTVDYTHPMTGYDRTSEVEVAVGPTAEVADIGLGSSLDAQVGTRVQLDIGGKTYRCLGTGPKGANSLGLVCQPPMEAAGKTFLFGDREIPVGLPGSVRACVEPDSGPIAAISLYEPLNRALGDPGGSCPALPTE